MTDEKENKKSEGKYAKKINKEKENILLKYWHTLYTRTVRQSFKIVHFVTKEMHPGIWSRTKCRRKLKTVTFNLCTYYVS